MQKNMGTLFVFFLGGGGVYEAYVPKVCKIAGFSGCCKGKRQSSQIFFFFFCLKHAEMMNLKKLKIRYKFHNSHTAITLYIENMLKLHFLQVFYE